ncbi:hypothetical protein [Algoriphagus chordae]|uniref:Uncharacterized protein n=1 Tax=Algoriphagus chordae TaxID=237019 RepID=A0A2W7R092_9BACT|nr:hypothetical protein [Algoriphagus chordae]PZX47704.1 hypothetical protein LV85_03894 [Algoriphagus chordae]PZX54213.1 hypothetical protein LV85_01553 [Algoriphagus chordae]
MTIDSWQESLWKKRLLAGGCRSALPEKTENREIVKHLVAVN